MLGNIVVNSCRDSFLQKDASIQVKSFYLIISAMRGKDTCATTSRKYIFEVVVIRSLDIPKLKCTKIWLFESKEDT